MPPHGRRGVLLLIVLSMLTLFLMLGTAYLVVSTRSRETARAFARLAMQADDTRIPHAPLLDNAFLRIVRGSTSAPATGLRTSGSVQLLNTSMTNSGSAAATTGAMNPQATQFESLLADKYGSSVRATAGSIAFVANAPLLALSSVSIPNFPGSSPGPAGIEQITDLPGRVVTILGAGRRPTSHRILRASPGASGGVTLVVDVPRLMIDASLSRQETPIIINGPEYMIHQSRDVTGAFTGAAGSTFWATNESWDAFDTPTTPPSNPFLCRLLPADAVNAPTHQLVSSGTVLNVGFAPAVAASAVASTLTNSTGGFAHGADNDGDGVIDGLFYDIGLPNYYKPNGDEVHVDVSALVVDLDSRFNINAHGSLTGYAAVSGTTTLPVSWAAGAAQTRVWDSVSGTFTNGTATVPNLIALPVGSGYGPADVNGSWMFPGASYSVSRPAPGGHPESYGLLTLSGVAHTSLTGARPSSGSRFTSGAATPRVFSLEGRYGEGGAGRFASTTSYGDLVGSGTYQLRDPGFPLARPGVPLADDTVSQFTDRGVNTTVTGGTFNGGPPSRWWDGSRAFNWISTGAVAIRAAYNSPPDLHGRMITTTSTTSATDVLPQLAYAKPEWGANETTDDPYEIRLDPAAPRNVVANTGSATSDNVFSAAELEAIMRPYDADSFQLPQRLSAMLGAAAEEARLRVTTDSWDTTAITGTSAANIRHWLRAAASATPLYGTSSVTGLIGGEIARGEKFNLNRPFTAPKPLAYSATHPYYSQRQAYFKDLYTLMVAVSGTANIPNPLSAPLPSAVQDLHRRYAQWAANVVEFRDDDSTMTPFEYDINPVNGWSVDGNVLSNDGGDRAIVWGAERPEAIIAATSAWEDSSTGEMFILLHRPWAARAFSRNGATSEAVPAEPIDPELDVVGLTTPASGKNLLNLSRKSGGMPSSLDDSATYPVWRIRLRDQNSGATSYVRFDVRNTTAGNELALANATAPATRYGIATESWECVRGANSPQVDFENSSNPVFSSFVPPGTRPSTATTPNKRVEVYLERLTDPRAAIDSNVWTAAPGTDDPVVSGTVPSYRVVDKAMMEVVNRVPTPPATASTADYTVTQRPRTVFWQWPALLVSGTPSPGSGATPPTTPSPNPPQMTRAIFARSGSTGPMWFPWNNRPFTSGAELYLVPGGDPANAATKDAIGILNQYVQPTSMANLPALASASIPNGLLDAVHVPTRFAGIHTTTGTAAESALAANAGIFADTLSSNQLSSYREPGRVNLNTIASDDVWNAVVAGPLFDQISGSAAPVRLRPGSTGTAPIVNFNTLPATGMHDVLSLSGSNGFTTTGTLPPVQDTHSRLAAAAAFNPTHNIYTATRLANTATTRSNVYGVWITIRESVANDPDSIRLHRAFYIFDRSLPVAFEPGQDHNVWDAVLLRRIIQ